MKKWLVVPVLFSLFALLGCENSEYLKCTEEASALWDTSEDKSDKQKAYWDAIARCKEDYQ